MKEEIIRWMNSAKDDYNIDSLIQDRARYEAEERSSDVLGLSDTNNKMQNNLAKPVMEQSNNQKNKKGSNRVVEPNCLIHNYSNYSNEKYLNISVHSEDSGRMAEWLLQLSDTQCPSGFVGSNPTPAVSENSKDNCYINNEINEMIIIKGEGEDNLVVDSRVYERVDCNGKVDEDYDNLEDYYIEYYDNKGKLIETISTSTTPQSYDENTESLIQDWESSSLSPEEEAGSKDSQIENSESSLISNDLINNKENKRVKQITPAIKKLLTDYNFNNNNKYINIFEEGLVGIIMMSEKNENDGFALLVDFKFEDFVSFYMNSSFSRELSFQRFKVMRVDDNFIDFVVKNFSQDRVFPTCFVNFLLTRWQNLFDVTHFSNNSSTESNLIGVSSLNLLFNSSKCSGLGGSSSTGCQSIASQNSQSSSVTSLVSLYLLNMSCFRSLTTAFDKNSMPNDLDFSSCILTSEDMGDNDYLSFSVDYNTEQKNKPLPLGSGQLLRNCFFSSVSKLKKTLFSWAQKFSEFLVISSKPSPSEIGNLWDFNSNEYEVLGDGKTQEIFDINNYDLASFLSQQCVEKAFKTLLIYRTDEFPKIHDLVRLGRMIGVDEELIKKCEKLNPVYAETRYPDISMDEYTSEDSEEDIKIAEEILEWVEKNMQSF